MQEREIDGSNELAKTEKALCTRMECFSFDFKRLVEPLVMRAVTVRVRMDRLLLVVLSVCVEYVALRHMH
jgi:hypothetical protein